MGYSQLRKGPNKVIVAGLPQPFNDAVKLFSKENFFPSGAAKGAFYARPRLALTISLMAYLRFPFREANLSLGLSIILVYVVIRINVYPTLVSG